MIAITSTGNKPYSLMDLRFAKCAWFALFENGIIEFVENPFQEEEHNAAPQVVEWLAGRGVTKVITGELGSKARPALVEKRIQAILMEEDHISVQTILERIR